MYQNKAVSIPCTALGTGFWHACRILSRSKAGDEAQYLRLCNDPRAQVDGTLATVRGGLSNSSRSLQRHLLATPTTWVGTPKAYPARKPQRRDRSKGRDLDGDTSTSSAGKGAAALGDAPVGRSRGRGQREVGLSQEAGRMGSPGTSSALPGLVAVVFNRVYRGDGFNMTSYELWQVCGRAYHCFFPFSRAYLAHQCNHTGGAEALLALWLPPSPLLRDSLSCGPLLKQPLRKVRWPTHFAQRCAGKQCTQCVGFLGAFLRVLRSG